MGVVDRHGKQNTPFVALMGCVKRFKPTKSFFFFIYFIVLTYAQLPKSCADRQQTDCFTPCKSKVVIVIVIHRISIYRHHGEQYV